MSLLGYLQIMNITQWTSSGYLNFAAYLVTITFYLSFSFSINNCFDHEGDRLGSKVSRNPIASDHIRVQGGVLFSVILALLGLIFSGFWFGAGPLSIYVLMLLLSGAYSIPPIRLKSVPFLDLVTHGLFFGSLIVLYGVTVTGGFTYASLPLFFSVFILSLILELRNQIDDVEEDIVTGVETTVVRIGSSRANKLFYSLLAIHIGLLIYILNLIGSFAITVISINFFVGFIVKFFMWRNRRGFQILIEIITPLVYFIFFTTSYV